jgi:ubiquinone/menaquinone biosynthesis C-methylase UbiE
MKTSPTYIPALRWHALTPVYDSVLRWIMQEEVFKSEIIRQAQIQSHQRVLDLGCGTATLTVMLKKAHPDTLVTGLDGDPQVLQIGQAKAGKAKVELILDQGLAYNLPYPDGSFDRVLSSLMFHHLTTQEKQQTMQEVFRVLRPGGLFVLIDFGRPQGLWSHIISPVMAKIEAVTDNHKGLLVTMMQAAGFKAVTDNLEFPNVFGTLHLYKGRKLEAEAQP